MNNLHNMNNIHVIQTKVDHIPAIPGEVTGLVHSGKLYYIIVGKALHIFGNKCPINVPLSPHPLLDTIAYYPNVLDKKIFVSDGYNFYFEKIGQKECLRIQCPKRIVACAYSPLLDKLVYLDDENGVSLCDIYPELGTVVEEAKWSLSDVPPAQINVHWGARSTQFAGFDNTTHVDLVRKAIGTPCTDEIPQILWRPDGKCFLISYKSDTIRCFKIFCVARGVIANSEYIPGLLSPISWQPVDYMIATACCSDNNWKIMIYEPNGCAKLVHLMVNNLKIAQLKWSKDGKILAVLEENGASSNVLLFTITGYCFELKQSLQFATEVRYIDWLESTGSVQHLVVVLKEGIIHYYLRLGPTFSSVTVDEGTMTAVINGRELLLVDTLKNITMKPEGENIDAIKFAFPDTMSQVVFNTTLPMFLCIDSSNKVRIYTYRSNNISVISDHIGFMLPILNAYPLQIHHVAFCDQYFIMYIVDNDRPKELIFDLSNKMCTKSTPWRADITGVKLIKTFNREIKKYTFYSNGDLYLDLDLVRNYTHLIIKMESFCYQNKDYLLVLDNANRLFCDDILVADNVTSFLTFYAYILLTRSNNMLYSCRHNIFLDCIRKNKPWEIFDFRSIPVGGVLVAPIPYKLSILIQDTVGVLEIISTGLLDVDYVNTLLDRGLWNKVHTEIKLRHLNLNVLADTNMTRFTTNIEAFIHSTQKQYLQDFVLKLSSGNVLETMNCKHQFVNITSNVNKISDICSLIVNSLKEKDLETYFGTTLLAMIKWKGLSGGVAYAQRVYSLGSSELNKIVEGGLKLICSLFNADDVLIQCLKTYDLDFALFSHFIHNRDPAATTTLIDAFYDSQNDSELRYKVNHQVGDYKEAVKYLVLHLLDTVKENPHQISYDDVIDYALKYNELEVLYDFLKKHAVSIPRLCFELALVNEELNRKQRAAELYFEAGDLEAAYTAYTCMFNWIEAIKVLDAMNLDEKTHKNRLSNFADHLSAAGYYSGAKYIHLMQKNYHEAIVAAIAEHAYIEAQDLIEEYDPEMIWVLRTEALNYISKLEDLLENTTDDLECYLYRIVEIRNRRRIGTYSNVGNSLPQSLKSNGGDDNESRDGAESVRTTFSSVVSRSSTSSRKSKKETKKYIDMRHGGLYEDIAIMRTIHLKIKQIDNMDNDLNNIVAVIGGTSDEGVSNILLRNYNKLFNFIQEIIPKVWINNLNNMDVVNEELLAARTNIIFLEYQYRLAPEITRFVRGDEE
ncbi:putative elongator complex protein 1 [Onthophagus taurus]|uniref:putative elongator complex protein 1 n=1 Tax=Onthophagus taurus TaxID=166361 RepID=UPI0039BE2E87